MNLKTVQTPALLLDLDKFTRNCNWMKEKAERLNVALRPHLKTGKLGVQIDGDRLGLGTNLFSGTKTLLEEFGNSKVNEIGRAS